MKISDKAKKRLLNTLHPLLRTDGTDKMASKVMQSVVNDDEKPAAWITTETGSHIPLNEEGKALGGMGGKATGKDFSKAKSQKKPNASKTAGSKTETVISGISELQKANKKYAREGHSSENYSSLKESMDKAAKVFASAPVGTTIQCGKDQLFEKTGENQWTVHATYWDKPHVYSDKSVVDRVSSDDEIKAGNKEAFLGSSSSAKEKDRQRKNEMLKNQRTGNKDKYYSEEAKLATVEDEEFTKKVNDASENGNIKQMERIMEGCEVGCVIDGGTERGENIWAECVGGHQFDVYLNGDKVGSNVSYKEAAKRLKNIEDAKFFIPHTWLENGENKGGNGTSGSEPSSHASKPAGDNKEDAEKYSELLRTGKVNEVSSMMDDMPAGTIVDGRIVTMVKQEDGSWRTGSSLEYIGHKSVTANEAAKKIAETNGRWGVGVNYPRVHEHNADYDAPEFSTKSQKKKALKNVTPDDAKALVQRILERRDKFRAEYKKVDDAYEKYVEEHTKPGMSEYEKLQVKNAAKSEHSLYSIKQGYANESAEDLEIAEKWGNSFGSKRGVSREVYDLIQDVYYTNYAQSIDKYEYA